MGNADVALARLHEKGAAPHAGVREVGDGIRTATVREPGGAVLGIIENPHFAPAPAGDVSVGPGR